MGHPSSLWRFEGEGWATRPKIEIQGSLHYALRAPVEMTFGGYALRAAVEMTFGGLGSGMGKVVRAST